MGTQAENENDLGWMKMQRDRLKVEIDELAPKLVKAETLCREQAKRIESLQHELNVKNGELARCIQNADKLLAQIDALQKPTEQPEG